MDCAGNSVHDRSGSALRRAAFSQPKYQKAALGMG